MILFTSVSHFSAIKRVKLMYKKNAVHKIGAIKICVKSKKITVSKQKVYQSKLGILPNSCLPIYPSTFWLCKQDQTHWFAWVGLQFPDDIQDAVTLLKLLQLDNFITASVLDSNENWKQCFHLVDFSSIAEKWVLMLNKFQKVSCINRVLWHLKDKQTYYGSYLQRRELHNIPP